jgi:hypothetical protein
MAGATPDPLTPTQAKQRLRAAARQASPAVWIRRHPYEAALLGLAAGFLFEGCPGIRKAVLRGLVRYLSRS